MNADAPALAVEGLDVRYGGVSAVRDVSLEVRQGEIVGLIGPNGAGKSTTLHAIMGAVPVHAGDIRHEGRSLRGRAPEAIARTGIALVPEGRRIFARVERDREPPARAQRPTEPRGCRRGDRGGSRRCSRCSASTGSARRGCSRADSSSSSRSARALVASPDVLLLDEPSLGLAPKIVDLVFEALEEVRRRGLTVLLVEQRAQRTVAFADRTYLLANGRVRLTLTPADADDTQAMVHAYLS